MPRPMNPTERIERALEKYNKLRPTGSARFTPVMGRILDLVPEILTESLRAPVGAMHGADAERLADAILGKRR